MSCDAVVIGAGANGLVAAHYLARAGRRVLVLDRREAADGRPDVGWVPPRIIRDLALHRHGVVTVQTDPWVVASLPGGGRLELWHDMEKSVAAIRKLSPRDASRWPEFSARLARIARLLEEVYAAPPPDPLGSAAGDLLGLAGLGWRVRRLGRQSITDLLRIVPMSVAELLDDWFETDALKGVVAALGVRHLHQGPRAGGTAFALLHHHAGSPPGVFRPPVSNLAAVLERMPGVEVRRGPGAEVARITVQKGRVRGVVLSSGDEIAAPLVASRADPRRTLLALLEPGWLDPDIVAAVRHIRSRGITARVTLDLDRVPGLAPLAVAPSLDYLERAHDDAKYGRVSSHPYLETASDGVPSGGLRQVDVHVQYAPCTLADGAWDGARREELGQVVVKTLTDHAPELSAAITGRTVQSPHDLEAANAWPEGQPYQAELALDQVLHMRPTPALAGYRTPVSGLYLCGPAMHPGGGIAGACGANAARVMLRDGRARPAAFTTG
jgi:phytoene dehydrogenase-like protein